MDTVRFNRLTLEERADFLWRRGQFVDSVILNHYCLMLYSINDRFIELLLDLRSQNILWIGVANEYDLSKYLHNVHIDV